MSAARERVVAVTPGDPAGVGPELAERALARVGSLRGVRFERVGFPAGSRPGRPTVAGARAAWRALERAAAGCLDGTFAGVVTGPVNKERMAGVGFHFPGQTEFFAARAGLAADAVTMALVGSRLRVFLVSTHVPLRRALRLVTPRRLARTLAHARAHLAPGLRREPQLAVAAWNPHAGEGGHIGREEDEVVRPALAGAAALGGAWMARVPVLPADTVFVRAARGELDGVVCLYHDQGLIPFKLLHFTDGVNITLGLPFVRTSPDHGTAYELAGTGRADARSMEAALRLAARLVARRDAIGIVQ